jgi:iron complex transport system substrate-binding protein
MNAYNLTFCRTVAGVSMISILIGACAVPNTPASAPTTATVVPATKIPAPAPTATAERIATATAEPISTATPEPVAETLTTNLDECATRYNPQTDYFPEKVTFDDASGVKIEYFKNYKLVTVTNPWRDAKEQFKYVLVQCGTPAPDVKDALVIEVPAKTVVAMSTTQLPHLDKLNLLDRLVGLDSFIYASNPAVRQLIKDGKLTEIGGGGDVNVEKAIALKPDLIMTYGVGDPKYDAHPKLLEAGRKTVLNSEYMEGSPLGRAEWIKFTSAFFNREGQATASYAATKKAYEDLVAKAKSAEKRPSVVVGMPRKDQWSVPAGDSYFARFVIDAGGDYLFTAETGGGSTPKAFEEVFDVGAKADVWLLNAYGTLTDTLAVKAADERLGNMAALNGGKVWNYDLARNENGGNDYFESGSSNPQLVLADLIAIFKPELLPDHKFVYFRQLPLAKQ